MLVDVLLLMGANRLAGFPHAPLRCLLAAGISGIYAGICMKFLFLGDYSNFHVSYKNSSFKSIWLIAQKKKQFSL